MFIEGEYVHVYWLSIDTAILSNLLINSFFVNVDFIGWEMLMNVTVLWKFL